MYKPIHPPTVDIPCHDRPAVSPWRAAWLRALLRLFADMACRLR